MRTKGGHGGPPLQSFYQRLNILIVVEEVGGHAEALGFFGDVDLRGGKFLDHLRRIVRCNKSFRGSESLIRKWRQDSPTNLIQLRRQRAIEFERACLNVRHADRLQQLDRRSQRKDPREMRTAKLGARSNVE